MEKQMKTEVRVSSGVMFVSFTGEHYYKFGIHIKSNDSAFSLSQSHVWRRYSEFCWIKKILCANYYMDEELEVPSLPGQGLFRNREDPAFLEKRREGLEKFLKTVLSIPIYRSDRALHLFTQTSISTSDIEYNLNGQRHDHIIIFRKYVPRRPVPIDEERTRTISLEAHDSDNDKQEDSSPSLTPSKSSFRSVLKLSNSQLSNDSPSPTMTGCTSINKRVTFSEQVRFITLASAWPADLKGF